MRRSIGHEPDTEQAQPRDSQRRSRHAADSQSAVDRVYPPAQTVAGAGDDRQYLTANQVAQILQVSEKTVYRWAKDDPTFPMLKLGGTVRFPKERLTRWLEQRTQSARRAIR